MMRVRGRGGPIRIAPLMGNDGGGMRGSSCNGLVAVGIALAASGLPAQTMRDSAGIEIVENARPALAGAHAWRISAAPVLEIGGAALDAASSGDSLYEFLRVNGVVRLSDGRIAVANDGTLAVRFYDARGKYVGFAGRSGDGPGEFRQVMHMTPLRADTLAIVDLGEVEYFTGTGRFVRRGAHRGGDDMGFVYPQAFLRDGSYAGIVWDQPSGAVPPAGRVVRRAPLVVVRNDGGRKDTLGAVPIGEQIFDGRLPYGRGIVFGAAPLLESDGERLVFGYSDRYEMSLYAGTGKLQRFVRREWQGARVTEAEKRAYRDHAMSSPGEDGRPMPPQMRARMETSLNSAVFAERFPAFSLIRSDRAGNLWVLRYDFRAEFRRPGRVSIATPDVATTWDVFDIQGRWQCSVGMPARFTPLDIGNDYVAGLARDADDVESVRVYSLIKP